MSESIPRQLLSRKSMELAFAATLAGGGIIMMLGALEMEIGWSGSGPEAGYFPFRIGVLILAAALFILVSEALRQNVGQMFLSVPGAINIAKFAGPLLALIALMPWLGLYLASILYLAFAIGVIGRNAEGNRNGWAKTLAIALITPAILFLLFEFGFRTPLPKGPLGPLLGML